jgi:hypothetical protein
MDDKKVERLGRKVLDAFTRRITDEIFLYLGRDPELLREYQELVQEYSAHGVNAALGKMITRAYALENDGMERRPVSPLLKKYSRHRLDWKKVTAKDGKAIRKSPYDDGNLFAEKKEKAASGGSQAEGTEKTARSSGTGGSVCHFR